jgi:hypothetical protein
MLKSQIPDDVRQYLNIIASETKRTEEVLGHVLDFHKASQKESELIEFTSLVENNLNLLQSRLRKPGVKITLSATDEKLIVYGVRDQLAHALYQIFRVVGEELIPPGSAIVRTENKNNKAFMTISFTCEDESTQLLVKKLRQVFSDDKASRRLAILVAGETIKYHGGSQGIALGKNGIPSIYLELPLVKEAACGSENPHSG